MKKAHNDELKSLYGGNVGTIWFGWKK